METETATEKYK